jgi:hypothetical protein
MLVSFRLILIIFIVFLYHILGIVGFLSKEFQNGARDIFKCFISAQKKRFLRETMTISKLSGINSEIMPSNLQLFQRLKPVLQRRKILKKIHDGNSDDLFFQLHYKKIKLFITKYWMLYHWIYVSQECSKQNGINLIMIAKMEEAIT